MFTLGTIPFPVIVIRITSIFHRECLKIYTKPSFPTTIASWGPWDNPNPLELIPIPLGENPGQGSLIRACRSLPFERAGGSKPLRVDVWLMMMTMMVKLNDEWWVMNDEWWMMNGICRRIWKQMMEEDDGEFSVRDNERRAGGRFGRKFWIASGVNFGSLGA